MLRSTVNRFTRVGRQIKARFSGQFFNGGTSADIHRFSQNVEPVDATSQLSESGEPSPGLDFHCVRFFRSVDYDDPMRSPVRLIVAHILASFTTRAFLLGCGELNETRMVT